MMMAVAVMVSWDGSGAAVKVVALVVMMIGMALYNSMSLRFILMLLQYS